LHVLYVLCKFSRGRAGRHHERAEEEAEDKELVADEMQQSGEKSWPDHLDEQPTSQLTLSLIGRIHQMEFKSTNKHELAC
jgi:hypothetical protein